MMRSSRIILLAAAGTLACGSSDSGGNKKLNQNPSGTAEAATSPVVMGQTTQLSAKASDPDGDTLSYSWAQTAPTSPQGSFSTQTSSSTTWTAPTVGSTTLFTLSVTVSDGRGGTVSPNVKIYAKPSADPSFIADVQPILDGCTVCHTATSPAGDLPLTQQTSYAALVNVQAKVACTTQLRVKPGEPDSSVLVETISGTSCGVRMPPEGSPFPEVAPEKLNQIRTWIQQGAANN